MTGSDGIHADDPPIPGQPSAVPVAPEAPARSHHPIDRPPWGYGPPALPPNTPFSAGGTIARIMVVLLAIVGIGFAIVLAVLGVLSGVFSGHG